MATKKTEATKVAEPKNTTPSPFEEAIASFLKERAKKDKGLNGKLTDEKISGCCKYIIEEVKKSGRCGFADEEIYGFALHFFDENIEAPETETKVQVVINREIKITPERIEEIRKEEIKKAEDAAREKVRQEMAKAEERKAKKEAKAKEEAEKRMKALEEEGSLFSFDEL